MCNAQEDTGCGTRLDQGHSPRVNGRQTRLSQRHSPPKRAISPNKSMPFSLGAGLKLHGQPSYFTANDSSLSGKASFPAFAGRAGDPKSHHRSWPLSAGRFPLVGCRHKHGRSASRSVSVNGSERQVSAGANGVHSASRGRRLVSAPVRDFSN